MTIIAAILYALQFTTRLLLRTQLMLFFGACVLLCIAADLFWYIAGDKRI